MTAAALILLVGACVAAVADWRTVVDRPAPAENVLKPLVLVALIGVALTIDPSSSSQRLWFVAALVLSMAGDVLLLPAIDRFVPGLVAFLLAHLAYVIGFAQVSDVGDADRYLAWLVLIPIAGVAFVVHRAVLVSAPEMQVPVLLYICVIAAMVVWSVISHDVVAIAGATLFATSDSILAVNRFEHERRRGPLAVMVTYHLAQALLVVSLA